MICPFQLSLDVYVNGAYVCGAPVIGLDLIGEVHRVLDGRVVGEPVDERHAKEVARHHIETLDHAGDGIGRDVLVHLDAGDPDVDAENLQEPSQSINGFNLVGYGKEGQKSWEIIGSSADIFGNVVQLTNIEATLHGNDADDY